MDKKRISKNKINLISLLLVIMLIVSEICLIPSNIQAATSNLEKQNKYTNNKNVKFDSFFVEENKNVHEIEIKEENVNNINFEVNVEKGYFTNGKIELEDPNFIIQSINSELVSNIANNTINLKDISDIKSFSIPINMNKTDLINKNYLNKETKIVLSGTYINDNGKADEIKKEIYIKVKWNLNTDFDLFSNITAVIPDGEKTIVQEKITFKEKERKNPIEQLKIALTAPRVNNNLPSEIRVCANSTKATNGDEFGKNFTTNNYTYDNTTGNIEITVANNANQNGEIAFYDATDEYVLTYIYAQNITELLKQNIKIDTSFKADIKLYSMDTYITKEYSNSYNITAQMGANVTAELYTTDVINKGFLYDNYNETGYNLNYKLNINNKNLEENIKVESLLPSFVIDKNNLETNQIYFKSIAVKEELFNKMLGTEGYINIYDNNNNLIATINKNTQKNSNGELEVVYPNAQTNIRIEISKPQIEGVLQLRNYKVIEAKLNYNLSQIKDFYAIREKVNISEQYEGLLNLNETYTKIDLQMDNTELMPFVDNNVNLTLNLVTNSNEYDLFKNPEIRIRLPEEVESINIGEISLVYNEKLKFEYARLEENDRVLVLKLTGEETNYKLGIQEGTKIIIPAVIRLRDTVPSKSSSIKLTYSNELAKATEYSKQGKDSSEVSFNIVAKSGLITISELSGYNGNETKRTLDENAINGQLEIGATEKEAKIETKVVNNFNVDLANVQIIGKIPFKDNRDIHGNNLGSTFDATLKENLKIQGVDAKVFYSENDETDAESSSWNENVLDINNVKSFKIVLNNTLKKGEKFSLGYSINIPANLQANEKTYASATIKYELNNQEKDITQIIGLQTPSIAKENNEVGETAEEELQIKVKELLGNQEIQNNSNVHEKEVLRFEIEATNNSNSDISNISIDAVIPNEATFLERNADAVEGIGEDSVPVFSEDKDKRNVSFEIENLKVSETQKFVYEIRINELPENTTTGKLGFDILFKINNEVQKQQKIENNIVKGIIETELMVGQRTSVLDVQEYTYFYKIVNRTGEDLKDISATVEIPSILETSEPLVIENGLVNEDDDPENSTVKLENNILTCNVKVLNVGEEAWFQVRGKLKSFDSPKLQIIASANTYVRNDTYRSNLAIIELEGADVSISKSSPTANQEVRNGDTITYNISVTNNSEDINSQAYIVDTLPKEVTGQTLQFNQFSYENVGVDESFKEENKEVDLSVTIEDESGTDTSKVTPSYDKEKNIITIPTMIPAGKTINITIIVSVENITQDTILSNVATVKGDLIVTTTSNEVIHYGKKTEDSTDPDDPNNPEQPDDTYSINGVIWLDDNENGALDNNEDLLEGNEIMIVNADTSEIVKDSTGAEIKVTSTNTGYTISGLTAGRYIVIFKYDRNVFKITNYRQEGVSENLNSKAISGTAVINGNTEYVGMTDVIEISNNNINSINMGLIKLGNFDIAIEKTISTIRTVNPKGKEQNYTYDNEKISKLEVSARNLVGTNVYIGYTIKISNNGESKGYISELVDELPDDLQFDKTLNTGWYEENGKLYYIDIDDIEVGQTKEIPLILVKKLTNDNLGITNNIATVSATSSNNVQDNNLDNNKSNAQLIIGTSTGRIVLNIVGIILLLGIIGVGVYVLRKYNIERR